MRILRSERWEIALQMHFETWFIVGNALVAFPAVSHSPNAQMLSAR